MASTSAWAQLRRDGGKLFGAQGVSASLDDQVLPFDEAEPAQLVIERREHRRLGSLIVQNAQPIAAARLLRARRERPCGRSAEQRDELAASYSSHF